MGLIVGEVAAGRKIYLGLDNQLLTSRLIFATGCILGLSASGIGRLLFQVALALEASMRQVFAA